MSFQFFQYILFFANYMYVRDVNTDAQTSTPSNLINLLSKCLNDLFVIVQTSSSKIEAAKVHK